MYEGQNLSVYLLSIQRKKIWDRSRQKRCFSGGEENKDVKSRFRYFTRNPEKLCFSKTENLENLNLGRPPLELQSQENPTPLQLKTARAFPPWFALCRIPFEGPRIPVKTTKYLREKPVKNISFWPSEIIAYPFIYYRYKEKSSGTKPAEYDVFRGGRKIRM